MRNQTPVSGRTGSTASRWDLRGPCRVLPVRPQPGAPRSSPAASQGASAAAAGDAAGAASAAAGRAPRPRQGPPPTVPAPVSTSHWPTRPQASRFRCYWPSGLSLRGAIEQPIYFSPALFPCISVAVRAGVQTPHLACTFWSECMQPQ